MERRLKEWSIAVDEPSAIAAALENIQPGELVIVQPKEIDDVIRQVNEILERRAPEDRISEPLPISASIAYPVQAAD